MVRKLLIASLVFAGTALAGSPKGAEEIGREREVEDSAQEDQGRGAEEIGRQRAATDSAKDDEGIPATEMEQKLESSSLGRESGNMEMGDITVSALGGVSNYTGDLGDSSAAGPLVGVMVGADWRGLVGAELGYETNRNSINDEIAGADQAIQRHNLSAFGKIGPTLATNFKPFIGAGLGASYVNVTDGAEDFSNFRSDFMQEVPVGAGLEYKVGALQAGVRGTYRFLVNDEFQEPTPSADNPGGGLLSAQLNVGGSF